jgi:hypothetical protein
MFDFRFNTHSYFPESGLRKHFQASEMRAIDSPHEITPQKYDFEGTIQNFSIFASIYTSIFPEEKRFQTSENQRFQKLSAIH